MVGDRVRDRKCSGAAASRPADGSSHELRRGVSWPAMAKRGKIVALSTAAVAVVVLVQTVASVDSSESSVGGE